jgi:hypothetical protein
MAKASRRRRRAADQIADRDGHQRDGRDRGVERAEQHDQIVRILVMVEMDPLPHLAVSGER